MITRVAVCLSDWPPGALHCQDNMRPITYPLKDHEVCASANTGSTMYTVKQNLDGSMPAAHTGRVLYDERSSFKRTAKPFVRAWGEVRHSSGGTPTDQRYTGQRDFGLGLYFYNARFYDPSLGRFTSADSLIPNPGNVLDWDRYAAMRNNPLKYTDPTGHVPCMEDGYCPDRTYSIDAHLAFYGVFLTGNWVKNDTTNRDKYAVLFAVQAVGAKFAEVIGGGWADAFRWVFDKGLEIFGGNDRKGLTSECSGIESGACTTSGKLINVESMGAVYPNRPAHIAAQLNINNIVHELGHAFGNLFITYMDGIQVKAPGSPYDFFGSGDGKPYRIPDGYHIAPEGASRMWVQNPTYTGNETFAHMFLGWTFSKWGVDKMGNTRNDFMRGYMPTQINLAAGR